jgi:hypothetical protein
MNKLMLGVLAVAFGLNAGVVCAKLAKEEYRTAKDSIDAEYKNARERCRSLAGNAKDICLAEAKGNQKVAKADLDARDKNTNKAQQEAREARAEANYQIAKEKCDDKGGNEKSVCLKEAKAARTAAMADAKVDRKARDARADTNQKVSKARGKEADRVADARRDANEDKRDADYAVARERCAKFAGDAKDRCLNDAKAQYGKR